MHSPCHPRCHNSARFPYGSRCFRPPPVLHSTSPYIHCFDRPTVVELNVEQSQALLRGNGIVLLHEGSESGFLCRAIFPCRATFQSCPQYRRTPVRSPRFFLCEKRLVFLCDCGGRAYCFKGVFQLRKLPPAAPPGSIAERVVPDEVPFEVEPPSHPKPMKTPIGVEWRVHFKRAKGAVKNLTSKTPPQTHKSVI